MQILMSLKGVKKLYKKYENNAFVDIERKNLDLRDYKNKLSEYRYVLCR